MDHKDKSYNFIVLLLGSALMLASYSIFYTASHPEGENTAAQKDDIIAQDIYSNSAVQPVLSEEARAALEKAVAERNEKIAKVKKLLGSYRAPLADYSDQFVDMADKYGLDYRLLPAIAIIESSGGARIPYQSYNAWGWGVATGTKSGAAFKDWNHAIETMTINLKNRYISRGLDTADKIGPRYAADQNWSKKVNTVMAKMI